MTAAQATSARLAAAARRHALQRVAPAVSGWTAFPRDLAREAAAQGLLGIFAPEEAGGLGLSFADGMEAFEELGRGDAAYAFALSMHNAVANTVARFGSPELRDRFARPLTSGEQLGCFSLTEPHAGSDAAGISTRAVPDGAGGYVVTGRKAWVSLIGEAGLYVIVCRTGSARGHRDMLMLAVPATSAGVRVERVYRKAGAPFLPIGELALEEVRVGPQAVIVPEGGGLQAALAAIDVARVDIAAIAVGMLAQALDTALGYTASRRIYDGSVLDLEPVRFMLADVETDIVAGRLLYRHAAAALGGPGGSVAAAHAKRFCPDAALRGCLACSEAMGSYGWLEDYPLARMVSLAKMLQTVDGTTEIQRVVIARELARRAIAR